MNKRKTLRERRSISRRKKLAISLMLLAGLVLLILYKIPYERVYTGQLLRYDDGESDLYGDVVEVRLAVRVQRNFLSEAEHTGTLSVNGEMFSDTAGKKTRSRMLSLRGALTSPESFTWEGNEWHGEYLLTRCVITIERGKIQNLYLRDDVGVYAGQYR